MQLAAGARVTAAFLDQYVSVIKQADEPVTSSTALQNDNELVLPVVANAQYDFECLVIYTGASGGDIKWTWTVPSGATLLYQCLHNEGGGTGLGNSALVNTAGYTGFGEASGATTNTGLWMKGSFVVSSTPGSLQLQWAQNTSNGTATTVRTQSSLTLVRVS